MQMNLQTLACAVAALAVLACGSSGGDAPSTAGDAADVSAPGDKDVTQPSNDGFTEAEAGAKPADSSFLDGREEADAPGVPPDAPADRNDLIIDGSFVRCPTSADQIPGQLQACEYPMFCWEFRQHRTLVSDCINCKNLNGGGDYHLGACARTNTVGGCAEQTSGGLTVTFYYSDQPCGAGSTCTAAEVRSLCTSNGQTYVPPGM